MAYRAPKALVAAVLGIAVLAQAAFAQVNPPSWWNQNDGVTSSFSWTFDTDAFFPAPTIDLAPYGEPSWAKDGRTAWFDQSHGHDGVWGVPAGGEGTIGVTLKNQASLGAVKHVWAQVDFFAGAGSSINPEFHAEDGTKIENLVTDSVDIGNGWKRGTASFDIVPQPNWESVGFDFTTSVGADYGAYIDNFYVGTHCDTSVPGPIALLPFGLGVLAALRRRAKR